MNPMLTKTMVAGGTVRQRRFVVPGSTAGQVVEATGLHLNVLGVCCQPSGAASGQRADVEVMGLVEVVAGAAIAAGAPVTSDAEGRAITARQGRVVGLAFDAAAAAGDIIRVLLSASQSGGLPRTGVVTAANSVRAGRILVRGTNAGEVIEATAVTGALLGIALTAGAAGETVFFQSFGEGVGVAGAAVNAGARLTTDNQGRCVTAAPSAGVNNNLIGIALADAAAAGDPLPMAIVPNIMQGA